MAGGMAGKRLTHTAHVQPFLRSVDSIIDQNVRLLNDIMEYTEAKNLSGILLFIDFRKAFDTIEWNFLHKCVELYNFGPNIRIMSKVA